MGRVAKRPIFHPELGAFLRDLRETKYASLRQAEFYAEQRGFKRLKRGVLAALETGATKNPDPGVLREFAALCGLAYEDLVTRMVVAQYQVALPTGVQEVLEQQAIARADLAERERTLADRAAVLLENLTAVQDACVTAAHIVRTIVSPESTDGPLAETPQIVSRNPRAQ